MYANEAASALKADNLERAIDVYMNAVAFGPSDHFVREFAMPTSRLARKEDSDAVRRADVWLVGLPPPSSSHASGRAD